MTGEKAVAINRAWELWPNVDPEIVAEIVVAGWDAAQAVSLPDRETLRDVIAAAIIERDGYAMVTLTERIADAVLAALSPTSVPEIPDNSNHPEIPDSSPEAGLTLWRCLYEDQGRDCDGYYPLPPVYVLALFEDDAWNRADGLVERPESGVTGIVEARPATEAEAAEWLAALSTQRADTDVIAESVASSDESFEMGRVVGYDEAMREVAQPAAGEVETVSTIDTFDHLEDFLEMLNETGTGSSAAILPSGDYESVYLTYCTDPDGRWVFAVPPDVDAMEESRQLEWIKDRAPYQVFHNPLEVQPAPELAELFPGTLAALDNLNIRPAVQ